MGQYDDLLRQATGDAADVASPSKYQGLLDAATGGEQSSPSVVPPSAEPALDSHEALIKAAEVPTGQSKPEYGLGDTFTRGLARGWGQAQATIPSLKAIYKEYNGDLPGAIELAKEAEAIQKPYGESEWNLQNIHSPGDFGYWLAEKLGEQGVNLLSMAATGGTGGLAANVLTKSLLEKQLVTQATARALMLAGGTIPTYGLTTAMETAGTSQEQFQVTGSAQPERSLAAGAAKGVLELWTPLSIGRALVTPGLQLGKTFVGGVAKTTLKEGATEAAQEAIDIYARKLAQPGYSYFKDGPTIMPSGWGEGMWRLAESGAAGAAVGGVFGAPFVRMEQRQEAKRAAQEEIGTEAPGTRTIVQRENQNVPVPGGGASPSTALARESGVGSNPTGDSYSRWIAKNDFGKIEGIADHKDKTLTIISADVRPEAQGKGHGVALYQEIVDKALAQGYQVLSDNAVSDSAAHIYEALKRRGYNVVGPVGTKETDANNTYTIGNPVYTIGPVSALRQMVLRPASQDRGLREGLNSDPRSDALGINALLGDLKLQEGARDKHLDWLEANTPRYVGIHPGADSSRIMTDTEIELDSAIKLPQSQEPKWLRVNQDMLTPGAITAHLSDLPEATSERVYFLPKPDGSEISQQEKTAIYADYDYLQKSLRDVGNPTSLVSGKAYNLREEQIRPFYDEILTKGLRVIPSRGAGFYYNGPLDFHGLPQEDVKSTGRHFEVGLFDPVTKEISSVSPSEESSGDFNNKFLITIDKNKLKEGVDYTLDENGRFVLKGELNPANLTPGITFGDSQLEQMQLRHGEFLNQFSSTVHVSNDANNPMGKALEAEVKKILPAVDTILKKIGIDGKIHVEISEKMSDRGAIVFADQGVIMLPPSWLDRTSYNDIGLIAHDWIMHELGHIVTFRFWKNLPVEIQDGVVYAWEQAKLQSRMGSNAKIGVPGDIYAENAAHWQTLPEFLAEQFRRWGTSSATATTELDKTWKDGGRKLEAFYREWEKRIGKDAVLDFTHPHYYFSAAMDYLRYIYRPEKYSVQQALKRNTLLQIPQDVLDSPVLTGIANQVVAAIESMSPMLPGDLKVHLKERLAPGIHGDALISNAPAASSVDKQTNLDFIEMSLFAIGEDANSGASGRAYLAHELVHSYERRGLFTPEEIRLLTQEARQNQGKLLPPGVIKGYMDSYRAQLKAQRFSEIEIEGAVKEALDMELRAYYVMQFANSGIAFSEQSKTILARFMALIEKIRNYLNNMGFQTKEDLLRAFFKGEMVHRADREIKQAQSMEWINQVRQQLAIQSGGVIGTTIREDATWTKDGMTVKAFYDGEGTKKESNAVIYHWFAGGQLAGELILEQKGPKGFEISWVETANAGGRINLGAASSLQRLMLQEAERDLGVKMKMPSYFTEGGFKMAKLGAKIGQVDKGMLGLYTPVKMVSGNTAYVSPHYLRKQVSFWTKQIADLAGQEGREKEYAHAVNQFKQYRSYLRALPKDIWSDPRLEQMFSLKRNFERDEVQGSLLRSGQKADENQLLQTLGMPGGETQDAFSENFSLNQKLSQGENARILGVPFELSAPSTMYSLNLKHIYGWVTKAEGDPRNAKFLKQSKIEADRIGWFTKIAFSLRQLARENEHIVPLQILVQLDALASRLSQKWLQRAGETQHIWDRGTTSEEREAIANTLFGLNDMVYRSKEERDAGTTRLPGAPGEWKNFLNGVPPTPNGELARFFKDNKLKAKNWDVIRRVANDFNGFLDEAEVILTDRIQKDFKDSPQTADAAILKLNADFAKYRLKPYFPNMKFGQYHVAIRENGKLVYANSYTTMRERDAEVRNRLRQEYPNAEITVGTVPIHAIEFQGLPAPILSSIKENLFKETEDMPPEAKAVIQSQKQWIEEFELYHLPDKSFRKRWLPSKGIPGHSMDALRVYTHYFQSGSRYLARLAYAKDMREAVSALQSRAMGGQLGDWTRARMIADYASNWLNYYLEPGRDGGKLRAFAALWYLGFSPMAAAMNLTQPFINTTTKMKADFGLAQAWAAYGKANHLKFEKGSPEWTKARNEMIDQGKIALGQAAELATYQEGDTLKRMLMGTKGQHFYRQLSYSGMYLFTMAERYNREVTMRAAWDLAMMNPKAKRLQEISTVKLLEIMDLEKRLGMSEQEAVAFLYAKEALDDTQYDYSGKSSDPKFMWGKNSKDFLIFFKYMQNTLFFLKNSGAPFHMLGIFLILYGLAGLPGSEDFNETLRLIMRKLFGKDFDLHDWTRKFVRDMTRGTVFDETGPDLALHGVSRYGFGLGLLPGVWGSAGGFDASANGSMGKIIPGFAEIMHGINTDKKTNDLLAEGMQKTAGAAYGPIFALFHALNDPGSVDSKRWTNVVMPRALKGVYNANRYGLSQIVGVDTNQYKSTPVIGGLLEQPLAATDRTGAKLPGTKFDPMDPMDIATILMQAAGASPRKVNSAWEAERQFNDEASVIAYRRSTLYVQMQKAVEEGDSNGIRDAHSAIDEYNADIKKDNPEKQINGRQLENSLKQRIKQKAMMESVGVKNKGDYGMKERIMDLYPGVKAERVK